MFEKEGGNINTKFSLTYSVQYVTKGLMVFNMRILLNSGCVILLRCFINYKRKRYNCSQMFHRDCFKSVKIAFESRVALKKREERWKKETPKQGPAQSRVSGERGKGLVIQSQMHC